MKNKRYSELKFKDFSEFKNFVKLTWNGKVVFDDMSDDPLLCSKEVCEQVSKKYGEKAVYSMFVQVVSIHHTALVVEGEE
jgi:hypothetical protein